MSNYLENLIAKSFNSVELARPRLASRFEPLPQGAPLIPGEMHSVEVQDFVSVEDNEADAIQENPFALNRIELNRELPPMTTSALSEEKTQNRVWRGNQQPVRLRQQSAEQQTAAQDRSGVQPIAPQEGDLLKRHGEKFEDSRVQQMPEGDKSAIRQNAVHKGHALLQPEETHEAHQANSKMLLPPSLHSVPTPIRRSLYAPQDESEEKKSNLAYLPVVRQADKITVQPRVALRVENQQSPDRLRPSFQQPVIQQAEATVPPTINVTIGRIEVRATAPAAAQARRQLSAAPAMSLEEYLRRRERGGAE
jgi:hypothetical protein